MHTHMHKTSLNLQILISLPFSFFFCYMHILMDMATLPFLLLSLISFFISLPSLSSAAAPKALLAPISFDPSTSLYSLTLGTSPPLLLDLESSNLWLDCINPTFSSPSLKPPSFQPVFCRSAICNSAKVCNSLICGGAPGCLSCYGPASPVCFNNSCSAFISNSAIATSTTGLVWTDTFSVLSTDGRNPGSLVQVSKFAFVCEDDLLLKNKAVPSGVVGDAGLSRALLALPSQLAAKLKLKRMFTYCLPSNGNGEGILLFGKSPIVFQPNIDVTNSLKYTPLLRDTKRSDSYLIGVKSISVNGVKLSFDPNLLRLKKDNLGSTIGGMIISSTVRYTQLETSIYNALASTFKAVAKARGIKAVTPIRPFDTCFDASTASSTRVGYNVPEIDFALKGSGGVVWQVFGANSVVSLNNDRVICLAFQRTGEFETRAIVWGTYQQQDALLQFDLAASRLGFLPTLLGRMATCSNFNFTSSS